jgi:hypothetical protein
MVTNPGGTSDPAIANTAKFALAFFTFDGTHIAATNSDKEPLADFAPARPGGCCAVRYRIRGDQSAHARGDDCFKCASARIAERSYHLWRRNREGCVCRSDRDRPINST